MILCVDPGLRGCGTAVFEGETLKHSAYVRNTSQDGRGAGVWADMAKCVYNYYHAIPLRLDFGASFTRVLIETQIIRPTDEPFKQSAIMEVQGVAGALAGLYGQTSTVLGFTPERWKGSVAGDVMTERISKRITVAEWENFKSHGTKGALDHNSIDAVGIGLYYLGRLDKQRIVVR